MFFRRTWLIGTVLAFALPAARGGDAWAQLRLGMTADEAVAVLGSPLIRTAGHGFELWTYDNGAEALLFGSLIGWTVSGAANVADRSCDIWRVHRPDARSANFLDALPRSRPSNSVKRRGDSAATPSDREWLPLYVRRRN